MVLEHRDDYPSEWAAITAVSKRLGVNAETLRNWIRKQQIDDGQRGGVTTEAAAEIKALKRRSAEPEQTIEILKAAGSFLIRERDPHNAADQSGLRLKRFLWDVTITEMLAGFYEPDEHGRCTPEFWYGSVKMWAHLQRQGFPVAKSTVERLMRRNGWQGVRRQKAVRTTIADSAAERSPDLMDRQFRVRVSGSYLLGM